MNRYELKWPTTGAVADARCDQGLNVPIKVGYGNITINRPSPISVVILTWIPVTNKMKNIVEWDHLYFILNTFLVNTIQVLFNQSMFISHKQRKTQLQHCQGSHSDWKTWKNGKAFSSGKVREFWTDWKSQGKVRENHTKYWKILKFEINIIWYFYILFLVIFKWTVYCLLKWIKFSVKKTKH